MKVCLVIAFSIFIPLLHLMAFDYFDSDIDYWNEQWRGQEQKQEQGQLNQKEKALEFDWNKHLNPKNEEFFKEGSYTPPAAFMELVRNPNDENIKNWFALVAKKNQLSQQLMERIQVYLAKNQKVARPNRDIMQNIASNLSQNPKDYKNFRFRLYFESTCPHCKRMMQTMSELRERGYYVELRQIDTNNKEAQPLPFPVTHATKRELREKNITSWPVLFVGDLERKMVYRLDGYRSTSDVLLAINNPARGNL